jgi:hypothetical protein
VTQRLSEPHDWTAAGREQVAARTTCDLAEYVYQALRALAAVGFMLKASPPDRLVDAIDVVAGGESLLAPSLTRRLTAEHVRRPPPNAGIPQQLQQLTEREHDVPRRGSGVGYGSWLTSGPSLHAADPSTVATPAQGRPPGVAPRWLRHP